jgi:hypothetical protein
MATCGTITASFGFNCNAPLQGGTADRAYIINYEDYREATKGFNVANRFVLESLVLAGAAVAFSVDGKNNSNAPSFELVKQTYADVYDHKFNFLAFDLTNASKKALAGMVGGRYVVAYENNFVGNAAQSTFEVLGANAGMEFKTFMRDPLNNDNQGAYVINMATPEIGKEPDVPYSFYDTDYATTKAALEALL